MKIGSINEFLTAMVEYFNNQSMLTEEEECLLEWTYRLIEQTKEK